MHTQTIVLIWPRDAASLRSAEVTLGLAVLWEGFRHLGESLSARS